MKNSTDNKKEQPRQINSWNSKTLRILDIIKHSACICRCKFIEQFMCNENNEQYEMNVTTSTAAFGVCHGRENIHCYEVTPLQQTARCESCVTSITCHNAKIGTSDTGQSAHAIERLTLDIWLSPIYQRSTSECWLQQHCWCFSTPKINSHHGCHANWYAI